MQASKREAKRDVESAARLAELPATSEALASGEIPPGHARLIARASGEGDVDEAFLVKAANTEPFDEFARTVKRHQQDRADDDGQALLDRQRKNRKARIFESPDSGMFVLTGEFDQITGARIATALTAKERKLWHREDPKARRTPQQRMADALAELICEPAGDGKSAGTDLLVIADFDVIKQQLDNPRLADGSAIPIFELHRLALEANLLPSIFDTKSQQMWLGRKQRTASEAQRVALIARDQHCIGCGANPLWCRAHHIIWWSKNGPTDLDNLVLVCDDCHHKIHDHGWTVTQHPQTGKYQLKPPNPTQSQKRHATQTDHPSANRTEQAGPRNTAPSRTDNPDRTTQRKPDRTNRTEQTGQAGPNKPNRTNQTKQTGSGTRTEQAGANKPDQTNRIGNPDRTSRSEQTRPNKPDREPGPNKPERTTRTGNPSASRTGNPSASRTDQTGPGTPAQAGPIKPDRTSQTEKRSATSGRSNQTEQARPRNAAQPVADQTRPNKPDRETQRNQWPNKPDRTSQTEKRSATSGRTNPQRVTAWEGDSTRDQIQGASNAKASQDRNG